MVTGGAGFIGANFIRYWLRRHPADAVVNYAFRARTAASDNPDNLADVPAWAGERYAFVEGDVCDYDHALTTLRDHAVEVIVHFAAKSHNSHAVVHPQAFFQANVVGTVQLMRAALAAQVARFHQVSTCEVYGDLPFDAPVGFSESSPMAPTTPYSASKAAADLAVRAWMNTYGLPATISHSANNYGAFQFPDKVIPHFVASALRGRPMTLYRQSGNKREWLHVEDHCRAIDAILQRGSVGQTYNIGSCVEVSIEGIADRIVDILGLDAGAKSYVADRPGHDRRHLLECGKLRSELGWQPETDFETGFRETVHWYRDNPSWWQPLVGMLDLDESRWEPSAGEREGPAPRM